MTPEAHAVLLARIDARIASGEAEEARARAGARNMAREDGIDSLLPPGRRWAETWAEFF